MPQPEFVPVKSADNVRPDAEMPVPDEWRADRPAELKRSFEAPKRNFGRPGPDQGYGIKLAKTLAPNLKLAENEHREDAVAGCLAVGLQRASLFGRGPTIYDFEHAFTLWGFLGDAPADLVAYRKPLFQVASHDYWDQRAIADAVPEATLRMSHIEVAERIADWRSLIVTV